MVTSDWQLLLSFIEIALLLNGYDFVYVLVRNHGGIVFWKAGFTEYHCNQWPLYEPWEYLWPDAFFDDTNNLYWIQNQNLLATYSLLYHLFSIKDVAFMFAIAIMSIKKYWYWYFQINSVSFLLQCMRLLFGVHLQDHQFLFAVLVAMMILILFGGPLFF